MQTKKREKQNVHVCVATYVFSEAKSQILTFLPATTLDRNQLFPKTQNQGDDGVLNRIREYYF